MQQNWYTETMKRRSESGSVIFFILIGVVLFAALSYVVGGMLRGGNEGQITEQKARLYAVEILDYARLIRQTIQTLKINNGCANTDISFENSVSPANYTNTNSPPDTCKVFHPDGGGLSWKIPNPEWLNPEDSAKGGYGTYVMGMGNVGNWGDGAFEIIFVLPYLNSSICNQLNAVLDNGYTTPPQQQNLMNVIRFQGTFSHALNPIAFSGADPYTACAYNTGGGSYPASNFFYFVLASDPG